MTKANRKSERNEAFNGSLSDGRLFEAIYNPGSAGLQFIVAAPGGQHTTEPSVTDGSRIIYPPERQVGWMTKGSIVLPSGMADYEDSSALLEAVRDFVQRYIDLPRFEQSLISHYAMMTWVWDAFNAFPYLRFKGEPGTGKTRGLEVLKQLCYRATDLGGASTASALFRIIESVRGTALLDESDYNADMKSNLIKLLNAGYMKDGATTLSTRRDDDWTPAIFSVGCPKVMANRLDFPDRALESRCLTIHTESKKLPPEIPAEVTPEFFAKARELRNQLLGWRINTLNSLKKSEADLRDLDGRAIQLALPIYSISPDAEFKQEFLRRLAERSGELREQDPLRIVLEAILNIWESDRKELILLKRITNAALHLAAEREIPFRSTEFTSRRVAEMACSLQFKKPRPRNNGVHILVDEHTLRMQCERLGIGNSEAGEASEAVAARA